MQNTSMSQAKRWKIQNLQQHEKIKDTSYKAYSTNLEKWDLERTDEPEKKVDNKIVTQSQQKKYKEIKISQYIESKQNNIDGRIKTKIKMKERSTKIAL